MEALNEAISQRLELAVGYVWGLPLVFLLLGAGMFLTTVLHARANVRFVLLLAGAALFGLGYLAQTRLDQPSVAVVLFVLGGLMIAYLMVTGIQVTGFKHALDIAFGKYDNPDDPGEISMFQALCTALSATVGLGNIAGVAIAMSMGGPGATFWMIIVGIIGMATKHSEALLGQLYRFVDNKGVVHGGPMHYIERGLGMAWKPMAIFYAVAITVASFGGANMFQTNAVSAVVTNTLGELGLVPEGIFLTLGATTITAEAIMRLLIGVIIATFTAIVIIGGIKRIGEVTSRLVPFMGGLYVLGAVVVIVLNVGELPRLVQMIITDAFTGTAAVGGFAGVAFRQVFVQGVRRACFSNEAGLGSAAIAHAAGRTDEPVRGGVIALLEPFVDTVVICTMTALVILISGAWMEAEVGDGVMLTATAFNRAIPGFGSYFIPVAVTLFAYSTLLSWSYYGERAIDYMVGEKGILPYKVAFCIAAVIGAVWALDPVVNFSDMMMGIMVVPNMIALLLLFPKVRHETNRYFERLKKGEFKVYK